MKSPLQYSARVMIFILLSCIAVLSDDHAVNKHSDIDVVKTLFDGNKRFVSETAIHPNQDRKTIEKNSKGQNPFAVIVSCSDSRVPVESLFDQGVGDIFVIRTAGNIIGKNEMGSIQYAVEHLGVKFIGVMGHTECGAVKAYAQGHKGEGNIVDILDHIRNEEEMKDIPEPKYEYLNECINANVFHGLRQLKENAFIQNISRNHGEVKILPLLYNVGTGEVLILDSSTKAQH